MFVVLCTPGLVVLVFLHVFDDEKPNYDRGWQEGQMNYGAVTFREAFQFALLDLRIP